MKKMLAVVLMLMCSFSAIGQTYGPSGASVQDREYWFNVEGQKARYETDLNQTFKNYERFKACNMRRVLMQGRWQICRQCGIITRAAGDYVVQYPVECR